MMYFFVTLGLFGSKVLIKLKRYIIIIYYLFIFIFDNYFLLETKIIVKRLGLGFGTGNWELGIGNGKMGMGKWEWENGK